MYYEWSSDFRFPSFSKQKQYKKYVLHVFAGKQEGFFNKQDSSYIYYNLTVTIFGWSRECVCSNAIGQLLLFELFEMCTSWLFFIYFILFYLNSIVSLHLLQELELIEGAYVICIHTVADTRRFTIIKGRTKSKK